MLLCRLLVGKGLRFFLLFVQGGIAMSDCTQHDLDRWSYRASGYELASLCFLLPRQEVGDALVSGEFADACREVADALGCSDSRVLDAIAEMVVYEGRDAEAVLHEVRCDYGKFLEEHFRDYSQWLSCMVDELDASALYLAVANLLAWIANAQ